MSTLDPGHPIQYLFRREIQGNVSGWRRLVDRSIFKSKNLFRKNLYAHYGCVNAVEFSRDGSLLVSGGDDRRILLWAVSKAVHGKTEPVVMQAEHGSNIFALALDGQNQKIFSAGNDDQVIVHDIETCVPLEYFLHEQPVYGVSINPLNDCIFASAGDDGRLLIYDIREPSSSDPFCLASVTSAFHAVMFHPTEPRLLVSGNSKEGVSLWDIRKPKTPLLTYGGLNADQCCMSARFNGDGSKILALRRRLPPILYSTHDTSHLYQFHHPGYYNSCTMKSCSFAGSDDQFILSGSDSFDMYMWKIPPKGSDRWVDEADLILRGHRSIVNQVRYNKTHSIIVSSGVEKLIKIWSPFTFNCSKSSGYNAHEKERRIFSHTEYINLVTQSGQFMSLTYDIARKSTREDPRMMAFFDALVQRDIEGWSDDSDNIAENSYTAISELESTSEDSSTEENSVVTSQLAGVNSSNNSSSSRSTVSNFPSQTTGERDSNSVLDSDSDDPSPLENVTGAGTFETQSTPGIRLNSSSTSQNLNRTRTSEEEDQSTSNVDTGSDSQPNGDNANNIIKELISKKHERLRQLAKAHVVLESTLTKSARKRKATYSPVSSSEDSPSHVGQKTKRHRLEKSSNDLSGPRTSTSQNALGGDSTRFPQKHATQHSSQDSSNLVKFKTRKCKSRFIRKKLFKKFKRLRYEKKLPSGEEPKSGIFCSYFCRTSGRYQHSHSSSSSSSDDDGNKPSGSSASNAIPTLPSDTSSNNSSSTDSSSSSSSSLSSSDSSSSESDDSSHRASLRGCSNPTLCPKRSSLSSESDNDSNQNDSHSIRKRENL